jgi:hypothetical protein
MHIISHQSYCIQRTCRWMYELTQPLLTASMHKWCQHDRGNVSACGKQPTLRFCVLENPHHGVNPGLPGDTCELWRGKGKGT